MSSEQPDRKSVPGSFPIVGIGASAGGLQACQRLLVGLGADTGMAFVFVPHLHPDYSSQFATILSRSTPMPVIEASDEQPVQPNRVYVIPPARSMVMDRDKLKLLPRRDPAGLHRPVDAFLRSLAEFHTHSAIGVLLSGAGSDGVEGLEEIKVEGGITFVQDDSAQFDGTPRSAIESGCVDFVLPPDAIARELTRISKHSYVTTPAQDPDWQRDRHVGAVLHLLRKSTGVDFANFEPALVQRRLERRMLLRRLDSTRDYLRLLRADSEELHDLYRDLLAISTGFFRDPQAFDALAKVVFPRLFKQRSPPEAVRAWILGCATGEEAFSMAIALHEFAESVGSQVPVQVIATDLNDEGIDVARAAYFRSNIELHVSPQRLQRFFEKLPDGYRVAKPIRDACVFARQNVLGDPPFSRMDLISCRNLLIYLQPELRQRVLPLFHYALKPHGFLLLGSAESIDAASDLFATCDPVHHIYRRIDNGNGDQEGVAGDEQWHPDNATSSKPQDRLPRETRELEQLLGSAADALVGVDEQLRIRFVSPGAQQLLGISPHDIGRALADLRTGEAAELGAILESRARAALAGETPPLLHFSKRRGRGYWLRACPQWDDGGRITGAALSVFAATRDTGVRH